ncbi:hypothetical protein C0991_006343 [Blastosporella zonata]|nr:hypothetical protein C0991_006343 [Blastosporella zonata]
MALTNDEWRMRTYEVYMRVTKLPDSVPLSPPSISGSLIALTIDHTLLKPDATTAQIDSLCDEALNETQVAIEDGAKEIDMVINIGALKSGDYELVHNDIAAVVEAAGGHPVKVIIETVFLTYEEKIAASFISAEAGASFVKTCTGFSGGSASIEDVALMKKTVQYKGHVQVKASAGIRSLKTCLEMLEAGADRIGT